MEYELTREDHDLIEKAEDAIKKGYRKGWHSVGAALRTTDGEVFTGIHFEATVGRIGICAEPFALANAVMAGKDKFDTIVAVMHPKPERGKTEFEVISPCGMCREMVTDYDPQTKVIIYAEEGLKKVDMSDLLPYKFKDPSSIG